MLVYVATTPSMHLMPSWFFAPSLGHRDASHQLTMSSSQVSDEIVEAVASNEVEVELTEDGRRKSSFQLPKGG